MNEQRGGQRGDGDSQGRSPYIERIITRPKSGGQFAAACKTAMPMLKALVMKGSLRTTFAGTALLLLALPPSASAQSSDLQKRLQTAKRIDCTFTALATSDWKNGTPELAASAAKVTVVFQDIDVDGGTAEAGSDFGESFIVVRYRHGYLHLMEMSDSGPLRVTTIFAEETTQGRMKAVQTRHEYTAVKLPGFTSRPEMYVGDCAVSD
jgi:hypothetical protein